MRAELAACVSVLLVVPDEDAAAAEDESGDEGNGECENGGCELGLLTRLSDVDDAAGLFLGRLGGRLGYRPRVALLARKPTNL
jgi:hypothetical protein